MLMGIHFCLVLQRGKGVDEKRYEPDEKILTNVDHARLHPMVISVNRDGKNPVSSSKSEVPQTVPHFTSIIMVTMCV